MDDPGAGSSARAPPAGAVVVPVEDAAPAAAALPAAGARPAWTRVRARVTWAGAAAAGALVAAAAAWPAAWTRLNARLACAAALFLQGCAAAGLAFFAMILTPADSRHLGKACAPPTDAEVAYLRTASEHLLLAASAQVVAATMGLLVPARPVAFFGCLLGAYRAAVVLWMMLVACHGSVHGALAFHFWLFYAVLLAAFPVGVMVSIR